MKTELDDIMDAIRRFRLDRGWSINRLAKESDVHWNVLQHMDSASWSPSVATLRKLLAFMNSVDAKAPARVAGRHSRSAA